TQQPGLGLYGAASMALAVSGSTARPLIKGELTAHNLRVRGSAWKLLRTNIHADPSSFSLTNGDLEAMGQGRVGFNIQTGLRKWTYTESSPITVQISAARLSLADLARMGNSSYPA